MASQRSVSSLVVIVAMSVPALAVAGRYRVVDNVALSARVKKIYTAEAAGERGAGDCPPGQRRHQENCVQDPIRIKMVQPKYPPKAKEDKVEGQVTIKAVIEKDGSVTKPEVQECTILGYGFEEAAIAAVREWRYTPARVNGKIRSVYFMIVVTFDL